MRLLIAGNTMIIRLLAASLLACASTEAFAQTSPTLIRGARVFDGTRSLGQRDVLIRDGRIAGIASTITPPSGATVVDGKGKTLLPGFIDSHTHAFGDALEQALAFGVTTEIDMFTDVALAARYRA